ncbi:MAG: DUF4180 domain-containing protein [Candidatus Pelethousia sp.]|nr:DUF4180 domain-containing protein [Candidatus Pelethousia sp.]
MEYKILGRAKDIALLESSEPLIADVQSALDLIMSAQYETGCHKLILYKSRFTPDFFILRTGLAGEVLQKFINYHVKVAIVGDYSHYTSKPLRAFIYESNQGKDIFFLSSVEEAVEKFDSRLR